MFYEHHNLIKTSYIIKKIAIIIPYFKPEFISETLNSLKNQTNKDFKVYISNDASKTELSNLDINLEGVDFEYVTFAQNMGSVDLVAHWERSLKLVNEEEWVIFLGDDDILGLNAIEVFYSNYDYITQNKNKICRFPISIIDRSGAVVRSIVKQPNKECALNSYIRKLEEKNESYLSEFIFLKEQLIKKGLRHYPLAWHTDDMLLIEVSGEQSILSLNESRVYIRMSDINISMLKSNTKEKELASFMFFRDLFNTNIGKLNYQQRQTIIKSFVFKTKMSKLKLMGTKMFFLHYINRYIKNWGKR